MRTDVIKLKPSGPVSLAIGNGNPGMEIRCPKIERCPYGTKSRRNTPQKADLPGRMPALRGIERQGQRQTEIQILPAIADAAGRLALVSHRRSENLITGKILRVVV